MNARTFASLRKHYNYRLFFTGQVVSVSGTWMQNIALAWFVLQLTHSPFAVGVLTVCRFGPSTILGLPAGVVADRFDNRLTVIATQSMSLVLSAILAALALTGHATVWEVYVLAALGGAVLVLDAPSRQGLTFQMVGRAELPNAVALNSSLFNVARIVGPAIGGVLIAGVGVGFCFAVNAVSFLAVLTSLLLMRKSELIPLVRRGRPTIFRGTAQAMAYVRRTRSVKAVLGMMAIFATLCFNFNVLLPVLAKQTLHAGPAVFGTLSACFGAGALVGALISAARGRASWRMLLIGGAGFGLCELVLAPERTVAACAVLLFVTGIFFTVYSSNSNATLQLDTPDHLRGRVIGFYFYAWNGFAPVGGLLVGWLCERGGTQLAFGVAGAAALGMSALGLVVMRPRAAAVPVPEPAALVAKPDERVAA
jgi:MFS family permease